MSWQFCWWPFWDGEFTWPELKGWKGDLQGSGIERSRIESPGYWIFICLYMFYTKKTTKCRQIYQSHGSYGWVLQHGKLRGMKLVMSGWRICPWKWCAQAIFYQHRWLAISHIHIGNTFLFMVIFFPAAMLDEKSVRFFIAPLHSSWAQERLSTLQTWSLGRFGCLHKQHATAAMYYQGIRIDSCGNFVKPHGKNGMQPSYSHRDSPPKKTWISSMSCSKTQKYTKHPSGQSTKNCLCSP